MFEVRRPCNQRRHFWNRYTFGCTESANFAWREELFYGVNHAPVMGSCVCVNFYSTNADTRSLCGS